MPGAIRHALDEGLRLADQGQDAPGEVDVRHLVAATDVVGLPGAATLEQEVHGPAMVVHVQPVAHVEAVAVERHRDVVDGVGHEQGDDLLRKLVGPVVVRRARHHDGHSVRREIGIGQPVPARLARGVGVAGHERVRLTGGALLDAPVDLVRRDLHEELEGGGAAGRLQQDEGAVHVRLDEAARIVEGPVHVCLRREVDHVRAAGEDALDDQGIRDVALDEGEAAMSLEVGQVLAASGVGQLVEDDDLPVRARPRDVVHEVGSDEPRAAGDEDAGAHRPDRKPRLFALAS